MILGEAPGSTEIQTEKPFTGVSGQLLQETFRLAELNLFSYWVTNVVKCRPPNNDFQHSDSHIWSKSCYNKWLHKEFAMCNPTFVLCVGNVALSLFTNMSVQQLKSGILPWKYAGDSLAVGAIPHPSWALRKGLTPDKYVEYIKPYICLLKLVI